MRAFIVSAFAFFVTAAALAQSSAPVPPAASFQRIQNRWDPNQYLNIESGAVAASPISLEWYSAHWAIEKVPNTPYVRIQNRWKPDQVLTIESGKLATAAAPPDSASAMWTLEKTEQNFVRIRNREKPELYIHIEGGKLTTGPIQDAWWSAQWQLTPVGAAPAATQTASAAAPATANTAAKARVASPSQSKFTGYQLVKSAVAPCSGRDATVAAACPASKRIISGGCSAGDPLPSIWESAPVGNQWRCRFTCKGSKSQISATALCMD